MSKGQKEISIAKLYPDSTTGKALKAKRLAIKLGSPAGKITLDAIDEEAAAPTSRWSTSVMNRLRKDVNRAAFAVFALEVDISSLLPDKILSGGGANNSILVIEHLATGKTVQCPGNIMSIEDIYSPSWRAEIVYGRMDPIMTYQNTKRDMRLSFEIDTAGGADAIALAGYSDIIKFLYPVFLEEQLSASPLWRVSLTDRGGTSSTSSVAKNTKTGKQISTMNYLNDTLVACTTFEISKVTPDMAGEDGAMNAVRAPVGDFSQAIIPSDILLSFGFTVLHQEQPAFVATVEDGTGAANSTYSYSFEGGSPAASGPNFPHGFGTQQGSSPEPHAANQTGNQRSGDQGSHRDQQILNQEADRALG